MVSCPPLSHLLSLVSPPVTPEGGEHSANLLSSKRSLSSVCQVCLAAGPPGDPVEQDGSSLSGSGAAREHEEVQHPPSRRGDLLTSDP